ncbi:hypothetical protein [Halomonas kalidii]|uniref:TonB-dependent receptor-like beta-barrel domain-containing protein n=1 Tax=Halomonas kalidii TaxID=3043293 RepID=A0ABT6VGH5_9GAMM|nr:hypothetical protein [Halomonas kalidii]MDI5932372.1 hypothetical protein [Halomonas kalidii]
MSLEDPADQGGQVSAPGSKSQWPDVTLRYTEIVGTFHYSVSGDARNLACDSAGPEMPANQDSALGWGLDVEAALLAGDALTLRGALTHDDGIGSYSQDNLQIAPAFATVEGELETIKATGGTLGASLAVGPGSFNATYSRISADLDGSLAFATDACPRHGRPETAGRPDSLTTPAAG